MGLFNSRQTKTPPNVGPPKPGPQDQISNSPGRPDQAYDLYYATY